MKLARVLRYLAVLTAAAAFLTAAAGAEMIFPGQVTGGSPVAVTAPFGGLVETLKVKAGDRVSQGDLVAVMATDRVYAPFEGTVSGVFGNEGDSTEGISERYGAVMYIEPVCKYVITASTEKAWNVSENKFIHIGEKVYLCCVADGTHQGTGIVTGFSEDGAKYNIEVNAGEFCIQETVGVFRKSDYSASSRIGRGTVGAAAPVAVKGSGSIVRLAVKNGDYVERGELLFETVEGSLDGLYSPGSTVTCPVNGIVSEVAAAAGTNVEKGGPIINVYADDNLMVEVPVTESDLTLISVGQRVNIEFNWNPDSETVFEGTVTRISYINSAESGDPVYTAEVAFTPDDTVRMGMTVLVCVLE